MTAVAESNKSKDVATENGPSYSPPDSKPAAQMSDVKKEDDINHPVAAVPNGQSKPAAAAHVEDAEGDSEAETLIQSPEKKRNIADNAPSLPPTQHAATRSQDNPKEGMTDNGKKSRKRKRDENEGDNRASSPATSSPLSSPLLPAQDRDSGSDASTRSAPRSSRSQRFKRNAAAKAESDGEGGTHAKARKRRPSDIVPPKHRPKGSSNSIDAGGSERRETRSATYPRHSSEERSPSPRAVARREHRRNISTQVTAGDVERKIRGRPPKINTRRNRSLDRANSASSADSRSPPRTRPQLPKHTSHDQDNMSPAKVTAPGPRKYRDKNGRTFLARAANNNDLEKAKSHYKERPEDLNVPDNAGNTPLQIAALEGYTGIVAFLIEKRADVDCRNIDKETPLIDAVENGHLEVVRLLLDAGANPRLGNAKGDEPYELVPQDDDNYDQIRSLIARAKQDDFHSRRRSSGDNNDVHQEGSTPAASAASPRDSPPIMGPRSPPPLAGRRRTGRSESTRNDLLWQANDQPSLKRLAAQGHVQGVAQILNVLNKAETPAVIAAARAGHEEVLQLMLAMGDAQPDPEPISSAPKGWNTPMLAAIGRGNIDVVTLLVNQNGFNATKLWDDKTYYDIAEERKGSNWQEEYRILKEASERQSTGKKKTPSPRKARDADQPKEKRLRRSTSPVSSNLRQSSSPALTHKSLPGKSPKGGQKERKKENSSPPQRERRKPEAANKDKTDPSLAVASDQEQTVKDKKGQKHRRSQSDAAAPADSETEVNQRRRRLVTGKEHRRRKSAAGGVASDNSDSASEVKREPRTPAGLKRTRSSASPEDERTKDPSSRVTTKKRRTVMESSPEESRPAPKRKAADVEMNDAKALDVVDEVFKRTKQRGTGRDGRSKSPNEQPQLQHGSEASLKAGNADESALSVHPMSTAPTVTSESASPEFLTPSEQPVVDEEEEKRNAELEKKLAEEQEAARIAEEGRQAEEARLRAEREAAEKEAAEKLAAEKEAAAQEAARKAAEEEAIRAAEEAEAKRKAEEEAAEAKRKAEEEAAAKKREEEERQERLRREQAEERKRRQDEQIRLRELEIERRRREKLPAALCKCALMLDGKDPYYYTLDWLSRFLPLFTVKTRQLHPNAPESLQDEEWVPNFQVACLLATKDLGLRNLTSLEKQAASPAHVDRLWKVARQMLSYESETNSINTSIQQAVAVEERERVKFYDMEKEIFWVKLPEFLDHVARSKHLAGLPLKKQPVSLRVINLQSIAQQSPPTSNGFGFHASPKLTNGVSPHMLPSPIMAAYSNSSSITSRP